MSMNAMERTCRDEWRRCRRIGGQFAQQRHTLGEDGGHLPHGAAPAADVLGVDEETLWRCRRRPISINPPRRLQAGGGRVPYRAISASEPTQTAGIPVLHHGAPTPFDPQGHAMSRPFSSTHDVVVVGARAAGAATAMLLARAGLDVLVVDRSRYGADTLSTHALMRAGVMQLQRWGCSTTSSPPAHPRCARRRSATPTRRC